MITIIPLLLYSFAFVLDTQTALEKIVRAKVIGRSKEMEDSVSFHQKCSEDSRNSEQGTTQAKVIQQVHTGSYRYLGYCLIPVTYLWRPALIYLLSCSSSKKRDPLRHTDAHQSELGTITNVRRHTTQSHIWLF